MGLKDIKAVDSQDLMLTGTKFPSALPVALSLSLSLSLLRWSSRMAIKRRNSQESGAASRVANSRIDKDPPGPLT
jgi:hypothetical protein